MIELVELDGADGLHGARFEDYPNPNDGEPSACQIRDSIFRDEPTVLLGRSGFLMRLDRPTAARLAELLGTFAETGRLPKDSH